MTKMIVNADDFGYCESVNYGIIDAHKNGIITSCSIMTNMPGFTHGVELLKENPKLSCGVHLTINCEEPVLKTHNTLVNKKGYFHNKLTDEILESFDTEELYNEFKAQIDKARNSGIVITHLDSHHNVHKIEKVSLVIRKILEEYQLFIRGTFPKEISYKKSIPCIETFFGKEANELYFVKNIEEILKYEYVELKTHPGFVSDYLLNSSSYNLSRNKEHLILTHPLVKSYLQKQSVELCNYMDITQEIDLEVAQTKV